MEKADAFLHLSSGSKRLQHDAERLVVGQPSFPGFLSQFPEKIHVSRFSDDSEDLVGSDGGVGEIWVVGLRVEEEAVDRAP